MSGCLDRPLQWFHDPHLDDGLVAVRTLGAADAPAMAAAVAPGEYACWEPRPGPYTVEDALRVVHDYEEGQRRRLKAAFAALNAETGELLGSLVLMAGLPAVEPIDIAPPWLMPAARPIGQIAELGYWVKPAARGRGVASRSLRLLAEWLLNEPSAGLATLWVEVDPANLASLRVANNAQFAAIGTLPAPLRHRGHRPPSRLPRPHPPARRADRRRQIGPFCSMSLVWRRAAGGTDPHEVTASRRWCRVEVLSFRP